MISVFTLQDLAEGLGRDDLARLTEEMCDLQLELIRGAEDPDSTFVPEDPEADDTFASTPDEEHIAWLWASVEALLEDRPCSAEILEGVGLGARATLKSLDEIYEEAVRAAAG